MYSVIRTPHPATAVEHSIEAHFFGPWERNLVIAGANLLRVFRLIPDLSQDDSEDEEQNKQELILSYSHSKQF